MKEEKQCFVLKKEVVGLAEWQKQFLEKCFEAGRQTSNGIKGKILQNYKKMIEIPEYIDAKQKYKEIKKQLEKEKDKIIQKDLKNRLKEQSDILNKIQYEYDLYAMGVRKTKYYKEYLDKYSQYLDRNLISSITDNVWKSFETVLFKDGKDIHFIKYGNFKTLEAKDNQRFLKYNIDDNSFYIGRRNPEIHKLNKKNNTNKFDGRLIMKIQRNNKDDFEIEAFNNHTIKYCILKREYIRKKIKYYLEIVFDGESPNAEKMRQQWNGVGTLGVDIGVQHLATYNDKTNKTEMFEIAEDCRNPHKQIAEIKRKMDRSRKAMNSQQFNKDGTISKGKKCKKRSNHYLKLLLELKELYRKPAAKRELWWQCYSKQMVLNSTSILIEDESYKEWQKKLDEGKGRHKSKKHYGQYIENKAPSKGIEFFTRKSKYVTIPFTKLSVSDIKATQYNHTNDTFDTTKKLTDRWNHDTRDSQRDLTSAMYLTCIKDGKIDKEIVNKKWKNFKKSHDKLIQIKIEENKNGKMLLGAMGIQQRFPNILLKSNDINAH